MIKACFHMNINYQSWRNIQIYKYTLQLKAATQIWLYMFFLKEYT
jgi:hypothetical protein